MKAHDFEYDGRTLSSFGMVICSFDGKGLDTISNGSKISFNTVPTLGGTNHRLTSTTYEDCLEATIQICKYSCTTDVQEITHIEFRELTRWLNRKKFLKFKILDGDYIDLYFEASFNISRIEINGKLYGLELEVITNRPFALKDPRTLILNYTVDSGHLKEIYTWEKYSLSNVFTKQLVESAKIAVNTNGSWSYIQYADEINVSNGQISLINPTRIIGEQSSINNVINGKYIYVEEYNTFYEVPDNARCHDVNNGMGTILYDAYALISDVEKGYFIQEVSSNSMDYVYDGIQDGFYYVFKNKSFTTLKYIDINDTSYEEGYIYPYTEITVIEDGDLDIYNALENRHTIIKNCIAGEVITMDYPIISSSISSHSIQNDFNWKFFRVANSYNNSRNDLTFSIPCTMKIKYSPIVKVGL